MEVKRIDGCTRVIGESQGYIGLPLRDIVVHDGAAGHTTPAMESAWSFDIAELVGLLNGGSMILQVLGNAHPPVVLYVEAGTGNWPNAAADVVAERARQIAEEGWTPEHDDAHDHGELARAASAYAYVAGVWGGNRHYLAGDVNALHNHWPWDAEWWKPTTRRRDLVKAGALILAEIERLDRLEAKAVQS